VCYTCNMEETMSKMKIKYTGKWPNLCAGSLTVYLDDKVYRFGAYAIRSGGECYCDFHDDSTHISQGDWYWSKDLKVPTGFPEVRLYELLALINDEIPHGCCGGCT